MELRSLKLTFNAGSSDVAKVLFNIIMGLIAKKFPDNETAAKDKKKLAEETSKTIEKYKEVI